jgi:hypothetical protein
MGMDIEDAISTFSIHYINKYNEMLIYEEAQKR